MSKTGCPSCHILQTCHVSYFSISVSVVSLAVSTCIILVVLLLSYCLYIQTYHMRHISCTSVNVNSFACVISACLLKLDFWRPNQLAGVTGHTVLYSFALAELSKLQFCARSVVFHAINSAGLGTRLCAAGYALYHLPSLTLDPTFRSPVVQSSGPVQ